MREPTYLFLGTRMGWAWYYPFPMPQQTLSTCLPNPGRTLSAQGTCANVHYILAQPVGFCGGGRNLSMCKILGWKTQQRHLPRLQTFFQFISPKWSSKVSRRDPGPISLVLEPNAFVLDHPRSGASPSVRPTQGVKLKE
jgi:hypothetical protein